jgi:Zn ribbon nucleic-acid-binding protein
MSQVVRKVQTPLARGVAVGQFRFPDGVEFLGHDGDTTAFAVSMPSDADGHIGRECPACEQHFRMSADDYDRLPDDLELWCVYCGHKHDHSDFMTQQQVDRMMRAVGDYAMQVIGDALDSSFKSAPRPSRRAGVTITYRSKPFYPEPLPDIDEERLIRERRCGTCQVRYAVFGEHRWCPVCGPLPPQKAALDALAAEEVGLDALHALGDDRLRVLRESGVLDRTYANTLRNAVSIVEALAEKVFVTAVPDAAARLKGRGKVFQRLDDMAVLYQDALGVDLRATMAAEWDALLAAWAARHLIIHRDGIIDAKYLRTVPRSTQQEGQRLVIPEGEARATLDRARRLCIAIGNGRPKEPQRTNPQETQ